MALCQHATLNLLESATVTLASGTEDMAYPLYRLYDRRNGLQFRTTTTATVKVKIDQGAGGTQAIDRLIVPAGHNLNGMNLKIQHSVDASAWTSVVTDWTQGDALDINKSWSPLVKRYWQFEVTSPSTAVQITEVFLTSTYTWPRNPPRPTGAVDDLHNVVADTTASGADRWLILGASKRRRLYAVPRCGSAQTSAMIALNTAWRGALPFWFQDPDGVWIFGKLTAPLDLNEVDAATYSYRWQFLEVLP